MQNQIMLVSSGVSAAKISNQRSSYRYTGNNHPGWLPFTNHLDTAISTIIPTGLQLFLQTNLLQPKNLQ